MRNYLIVSLVALACAGCASNRMDNGKISTAGQFSIRKDPIVTVKQRTIKTSGEGGEAKAYYDNPSLEKMIAKYYARSQDVEEIETKAKGGVQIEAKPQSAYANALIDYRAAGFDASRGICEYALNRLGEAHSDYRFANKTFNVGSGAVSSLMGIFAASARSVSVYATSSALLQAWSQDFEEYAYLTASIGTVGEKVKAAQDTYRKGVEGQAPDADGKVKGGPKGKYDVTSPLSWSDATLQIQQYNNFCLATGMRTLVEKAVGKADVYFDSKSNSVEFFSTQNLQELKFALQQKERVAALQEFQDAQKRVDSAYSARETGYQKYNAAKATVERYRSNPYYDATKRTVDLSAAKIALQAATNAASAPDATQAAKDTLKSAQDAVDQANALTLALADINQYDQNGATAAQKAIDDATKARDAVQAKLNAPAATS